jgi:DNA-binding beta-propeller fold protein YncE
MLRQATGRNVTWFLVEEIGLSHRGAAGAARALAFPTSAARLPGGATMIVDARATHKLVPLRAEYRLSLIEPDGAQHSQETGPWTLEDGPAFPLDNGAIAVLRVPRWELAVFRANGGLDRTVALWTVSKKMPVVAAPTPAGGFVVAFGDRVHNVELAEVDRDGRLVWELPEAGRRRLGFPGSVQSLPSGNVLVADTFGHVALELTRAGDVVWQLGTPGDPGLRGDRLSAPHSVREVADGTRLVADTRNHRILEARPRGVVRKIVPPRGRLCMPTFADRLPNGHVLVCDAGNARVVECDDAGRIVWEFGAPNPAPRAFSFPRSVEPRGDGGLLVSDTANDRIVVARNGHCEEWPVEDARGLFWPRCARMLPSGSVLVADGRHGRVLEIEPTGRIVRVLERLQGHLDHALDDPHDVRLLTGGRMLVTDAPPGLVVETDWAGNVYRYVDGLRDPHSAQLLSDGRLLIADSAAERVLWVAPDGTIAGEWRSLSNGTARLRLSQPRYVEQGADGTIAVVDTRNNRVLLADENARLVADLTTVPGSAVPSLDQPRWAHLPSPGELLVADHGHHRVLRLRYET